MPTLSSQARSSAVVAGLGMALLIILLHQKLMGYDQEGCSTPQWTTLNERDDGLSLRQRAGRCKLKLDLRGDLRWNESEDQIAWIERSGLLHVKNRTESAHHELLVRGSESGSPQLVYERDGEERELDVDARAWLHEIAMVMFRRLGVDAEERSRRILEQKGPEGLADEIEAIRSDQVASLYARTAFDTDSHQRTEAPTAALHAVARSIGSDHYVAELLLDLAQAGLPPGEGSVSSDPKAPNTDFERALRKTLGTIGSDYEMRRSIHALLNAEPGPFLTEALFDAARQGLGSDYDAAEVVVQYANELEAGSSMSPGVAGLLRTIGSDYEMRRSVEALLETHREDEDLRVLLTAAKQIGSDYDLAEVLVAMARSNPRPAVDSAYRATLRFIGSDYERKRAEEAWNLVVPQEDPAEKKDAPS
ncbi:MAG: hypothetical protein MPN21_07575 [Thermoanaerobaculia bacterium]|nr:hypothetical protein [Thermoanaerobaculia bacterium]